MRISLIGESHQLLRKRCSESAIIPYWLPGEMVALMLKSGGVGLAAPQVGWNCRLFVTKWGEVFLNPVLTLSEEKNVLTEGCLSLPGIQVPVARSVWVEVAGKRYSGIQARVIQHEFDHLEGRLITDYQK